AGHLAVVKLLLERAADPAVRSTYLDMSPYELACFGGFGDAAALLSPYAGSSVPHPSGMSPLWLAAATRLEEAVALERVRRLLAGGADPNAVWRGATPLLMATGHAGHFEVADALVAAGADVNRGVSMLHADWHWQHVLPALRYLHAKGWEVKAADDAPFWHLGRTPRRETGWEPRL
ncbi:MAG: ankyrin repeat domain-containing protein, partial [Bryobacterales bacterium]|nr:ankyrin repeat domain-containing protein [Bryobacterales bacterium]